MNNTPNQFIYKIIIIIIIIIIINEHWYKRVTKLVKTNPEGRVTVLWNQQVQTDRNTPSNKPDIIIRDNRKYNM